MEIIATFAKIQTAKMIKNFNWKFPLLLLVVVGAYYVYSIKFSTPRRALTVVADSVVFKRGCANAGLACLRLNFNFPAFADKISGKLSESIYSDYLLMIEDSSEVNHIEAFKNKLVDISYRYDSSFVDFSSSFPDASNIQWFVNIDFETLRNDGKILTLRYFYTDYMGGAHGMQNYHYKNFDIRKSKKLELADIFGNMDDFYTVAEAAFNEKYQSDRDAGIFWFTNNKYELPQEYGFDSKAFILHYNAYEIASYAQGNITIEIPYSKLKGLLKSNWNYLTE
jgi:hypothetical protein